MNPKPYYLTAVEAHHADLDAKVCWHRVWKRRLNQIAKDLNWPEDSFRVRSNLAGPAILGDVTLHGEQLYIALGGSFWKNGRPDGDVLYRTVDGIGDYTGGHNQWTTLQDVVERPLEVFSRWKLPEVRDAVEGER